MIEQMLQHIFISSLPPSTRPQITDLMYVNYFRVLIKCEKTTNSLNYMGNNHTDLGSSRIISCKIQSNERIHMRPHSLPTPICIHADAFRIQLDDTPLFLPTTNNLSQLKVMRW
jgi:hypothetical protein